MIYIWKKAVTILMLGLYNSCLPRFFWVDDRIGAKRNPALDGLAHLRLSSAQKESPVPVSVQGL